MHFSRPFPQRNYNNSFYFLMKLMLPLSDAMLDINMSNPEITSNYNKEKRRIIRLSTFKAKYCHQSPYFNQLVIVIQYVRLDEIEVDRIFLDQNDSTFQDESEDTSDSKLEYNLDSISVTPFESSTLYNEYSMSSPNLECTTLLYTSESSFSSEQFNLDNSENLTLPSDSFTYSDSSNIKNTKKHKSVFATSFNKKPKPGKSW
ncbi:16551_t:CDS:2, partial [Gigaspora rosea]